MSAVSDVGQAAGINRHSPCVGICRLDPISGWCDGCGRTGREIADWIDASDDDRLAIFARLPERLAEIGMGTRVLPWTATELLDAVAERSRRGGTLWSIGRPSHDVFANFKAEACVVERRADVLTLSTAGQVLTLSAHEKLRGFADVPADAFMALGLPNGRSKLPPTEAVTRLSEDTFDTGLGTALCRVAVRAFTASGRHVLAAVEGRVWGDVADDIAKRLCDAPVAIVTETVLARLETRTTGAGLIDLGREHGGPAVVLPPGLVPNWAQPMLIGRPMAD
jgi:predicted Fe-S protein YdhL (DUF1289 family)